MLTTIWLSSWPRNISSLKRCLITRPPRGSNPKGSLTTTLATRWQPWATRQKPSAYRKAVQLDPKLPEAYANLGNSLARVGDLDQAVNNYQKALELDSNNPAILNNLGHALAREDRHA